MIHLFENDPRFNTDPTFYENHGSFSVINYGINDALKKNNLYSNADDAVFIGFATSLDLSQKYKNSIPFYITVWETINTLTVHHIQSTINQNKIIFGMSDQITSLYRKYGISCETLHCGCDTDFWKPTQEKNKKFTFIHVNSSNIRSGLDLTLQAFKNAFQNNYNVQLIVKDTYNSPILANKIQRLISSNCNIIYISDRLTRSQIRDLYSSSHVGLNVLRMTSWGFPLHEMSACGCLCVTGNVEPTNVLLKKDHSILINPSKEIEILSNANYLVNEWGLHNPYGFDIFGYPESPRYYDFDLDEYACLLKETYNNWESYKNIDTITPIRKNWKWEDTALRLFTILKEQYKCGH